MNSPIPALDRALTALSNILAKAEAHCAERKIDPAVLLRLRLFPDMYDLTRQVQLTCDFAVRAAARLAGAEIPSFPDVETTLPELQARIAAARAYLASVDPQALAGAAGREIIIKMRDGEMKFDGETFYQGYALPQLYFHLATAYNILRHNGVALGKRDYMGG